MMKAFAVFEPEKMGFVDIPIPEPGDYEALVKIEACVICNSTDLMIIKTSFGCGFPLILGHESIGKVIKAGKKVRHLKVGDMVTRANAVPEGYNKEFNSGFGGFAEYGVVKDAASMREDGFDEDSLRWVHNKVVAPELSLEQASLVIALSETASCLMQFEPLEGKNVVVMGTGIAGLSMVLFSKIMGVKKVICIGRRKERLEVAKKLGADAGFLAGDENLNNKIMKLTENSGADHILEASGNFNVFKNGFPFLKNGGTVAIYGVPEKPFIIDTYNAPKSFKVFTFSPNEQIATEYVCDLLKQSKIPADVLLTHKWSFGQLPEALEIVRRGEVLKGIVYI